MPDSQGHKPKRNDKNSCGVKQQHIIKCSPGPVSQGPQTAGAYLPAFHPKAHSYPLLPLGYFGKRKQVTKVTFLVKEQNVSVTPTEINGIS